MEEKITAILEDVNPDILTYTGDDLLHDGVIDSFDVVSIVTGMEEELNVEIAPEDVVREHFASVEAIIELAHRYC